VFIGHYGSAFGAKAAARRVPLWVCFIAVPWRDRAWPVLVPAGVEKMKIGNLWLWIFVAKHTALFVYGATAGLTGFANLSRAKASA
jgi:hypothetical protein